MVVKKVREKPISKQKFDKLLAEGKQQAVLDMLKVSKEEYYNEVNIEEQ